MVLTPPTGYSNDREKFGWCFLQERPQLWGRIVCGQDDVVLPPIAFKGSLRSFDIIEFTSELIPGTAKKYTFSSGVKRFIIRLENTASLRWSYSNALAGEFVPMGLGAILDRNDTDLIGVDIYLKSTGASQKFFIEEWT